MSSFTEIDMQACVSEFGGSARKSAASQLIKGESKAHNATKPLLRAGAIGYTAAAFSAALSHTTETLACVQINTAGCLVALDKTRGS